ncbi:hypothetical protein QC761_304575 [Podospora bellae-mahoneyi]|uniref:WW domain-containing protein n=1 Tax=Podospora bellae-mahoneyi TaxID=2093777 RepID=A0ABR0FMT7_9PEZI|nr:hypothetical protein QC761_304575 [Podospora bellae-mahoneyi]
MCCCALPAPPEPATPKAESGGVEETELDKLTPEGKRALKGKDKEVDPEAELDPKAETVPEAEVDPKAEPVPEAEVAPKAEVVPKAETVPEAQGAQKAEVIPEAEVVPKAEVVSKAEVVAKAEVIPKADVRRIRLRDPNTEIRGIRARDPKALRKRIRYDIGEGPQRGESSTTAAQRAQNDNPSEENSFEEDEELREIPLPPEWVCRRKDSGKVFINLKTGKETYDDPRGTQEQLENVWRHPGRRDFPPDWDVFCDSAGRHYYADFSRSAPRRTRLDPRGDRIPRGAGGEILTPEHCHGWVKLRTRDHIPYYINKITGERSWEDPLEREGGRGTPPVAPEDLRNLLSLKRVGNAPRDVNNSTGGEETPEDPPAAWRAPARFVEALQMIPDHCPGWVKIWTAGNVPKYINTGTGEPDELPGWVAVQMPENVLHYINIRTGELAEEDPRDLLARRACSDPLRPWVWPSSTRFRRCDGTLAGARAGEGSSAGGGEGSSSGASAKAGAEITPMEVLSSNMMFRTRDGTLVPSGGARADVASGSGGGAGAGIPEARELVRELVWLRVPRWMRDLVLEGVRDLVLEGVRDLVLEGVRDPVLEGVRDPVLEEMLELVLEQMGEEVME